MKTLQILCFYFFGLTIITYLVGCKKDAWLNIKSKKSQVNPVTIEDFQALLDLSEYRMNYYCPILGEIASDNHHITTATWQGVTSNAVRNAYTWSKTSPYLSDDILEWQFSYHNIFICNLALEGLEEIKVKSSEELRNLNNCKGQALFHRANTFYNLAQIWSPPFDSATASSDLSIPLRLESDVTLKSKRSNVRQTYDQIIIDLKEAKELLPENALYATRGSKISTAALLARVYLSVRNYDSALKYSDECLRSNNTLLNYNSVPKTENYIGGFNSTPKNVEVIFYHSMSTDGINGFLTTNCLIDSTFYNKYDTNDLRRELFFKVGPGNVITFKGNYDNNSARLFAGLATDEIYLIRAECFARQGSVEKSMKDLNTLLKTRWREINGVSTYTDQTTSDQGTAIKKILEERNKELLLRAIRWTDLRRLNKEPDYQIELTRSIGGNIYNLNPNSYKYTFPIPDDVIQLSGMEQNFGW